MSVVLVSFIYLFVFYFFAHFLHSSPVSSLVSLFIEQKITPSSKSCISFFSPQGDFHTTSMKQFTQKLHFETLSINNQMCKLNGTQNVKHYGRLKLISVF